MDETATADQTLIKGKTRARWQELSRLMAIIAVINLGSLLRLDSLVGPPSRAMAVTILGLFCLIAGGGYAWLCHQRSRAPE